MMLAGIVKVRAVTWRNRMNTMPIQMRGPDAASGGFVVDGRMERYGARK
jgi:hypothetical protein